MAHSRNCQRSRRDAKTSRDTYFITRWRLLASIPLEEVDREPIVTNSIETEMLIQHIFILDHDVCRGRKVRMAILLTQHTAHAGLIS